MVVAAGRWKRGALSFPREAKARDVAATPMEVLEMALNSAMEVWFLSPSMFWCSHLLCSSVSLPTRDLCFFREKLN
jgi:hypothetical protein